MNKVCLGCNNVYSKKVNTSKKEWETKKFCSKKCYYEYTRITKKCKNCGENFQTPQSLIQIKFCSATCRAEYKRKNPNEYNLFPKGHKNYCIKEKSFWLGKKLSKNHRENISKGLQNNPKLKQSMIEFGKTHSGKNHWNWKGGITEETRLLRGTEEYKLWRSKVYARDNWTCKMCNKKLKNLVAHHVKTFKEHPMLRHKVSNGLTLCRSCHKKVHEEIGKLTRFKKMENSLKITK